MPPVEPVDHADSADSVAPVNVDAPVSPTPHPPDARSRWPRRLGRVLGLLVITLILLEAGAWLLFEPLAGVPRDFGALEQTRRERIALATSRLAGEREAGGTLFGFHPYLGYVGNPGARPWTGVDDANNAYGLLSMAGHPYPYRREPGDFVIGVLGGSLADIFANVAEADLQAALAERDPRFADRRVVLLSLGVGGYKQPQQLFMLEYLLLSGFEFDQILNIDGYNDLIFAVNNQAHGVNPIYPSSEHFGPLTESLRTSPNPEVIRHLAAVFALYERERQVLGLIQTPPFKYSVFLNALGARLSQFVQSGLVREQTMLSTIVQDDIDPAFRGPPAPSADDPADLAVAIWRDSSAMIHAILRDRGIPYVHVLQPNQYVPDSKPLSEQELATAYVPDSIGAERVRHGYPRLIEAGAEIKAQGLPFYDMTGIFADVTDDVYVDNCCHVNPVGNRILAGAIADAIIEQLDPQESQSP
jgi:hypothetical protein